MFLEKKLGIVNRWPLPSIDECVDFSQYVKLQNPSIDEFASTYKIGEPKARRLLEGLRACGFISLNRGRFFSTEFFDKKSELTNEDLVATAFYFYTQNSTVGSWLINDFFNAQRLGERKKAVIDLKKQFLENLLNGVEKTYCYKPLFSELYTYFGNFSGKARHRSPFSSLEMFHSDLENDIIFFRSYQPSPNTLYFLLKSALIHFHKNINNFSIRFLLESEFSPFRTFLLSSEESKNYLLDFQKIGYVRIVESADISHVYFEKLEE